MLKSKGFTLIELVVVIVILGILAVTAAPKFLNLQDDARVSTLKALSGAINSATGIVFGKSAVAGIDSQESGSVDGIAVIYGYPEATFENLTKFVDGVEDANWQVYLEAADCGVTGCVMLGYPGQDITKPESLCVVGYFSSGYTALGSDVFMTARSYFIGEECGGMPIFEVPFIGG
ncbi:type II secretion system protein [Vibrio rumoiensis]|uniref:MSHA biogenesis protein MshA n=1 Tax=Vibrio rumoiensis 1S-45 TaxID=1188252 RepID=A0A1E5E4Y2_9VIBR|nr:prepilin-type N-terminal cleavage/methylation domain-containing protein [Vibrio rumoiensis]OEF28177.1 hypothetical protein A1QC_05925 [Vibrio rumoiensis 1S-45]